MPNVTRENGIYYLELEGTPYAMGQQHGQALAGEIRSSIAEYKANVINTFGADNASKIIDWALNQANFRNDIEKYAPHVMDEMQGLADGAGVPFEDILLHQMFEEVYEAAPLKVGVDLGEAFLGHGCTSFACVSNGRRFNGQNMDYSPNLDGKQAVFRYNMPDRQVLMYGFIGQVGGIGANSNGLSLFVTTLPQGNKREEDGLGSTFLLRLLLEQGSVEKAVKALRDVPRFGALSYALSDFDKSLIVEASADEMVVMEPTQDKPYLAHTNHLLEIKTRNDLPPFFENGEPVWGTPMQSPERLKYAEEFLGSHRQGLVAEDFLELFTNPPVNLTVEAFMTLQSGLAVYEGDTLTLYVSAGTDPNRGWNEYTF
jgi:predicted choloylglycine hydrolase